MKVKVEKNIAC